MRLRSASRDVNATPSADDSPRVRAWYGLVRGGALLGLPTETVYGLAADASSDAAVAQIFAAKGRPSDHPLIVHVADASGVAHFAASVPPFAQALMQAFWPGPLTLVLPLQPAAPVAAALMLLPAPSDTPCRVAHAGPSARQPAQFAAYALPCAVCRFKDEVELPIDDSEGVLNSHTLGGDSTWRT